MIIITGMHRSGTSFTANMLYELDLKFGEPTLLMPADQWNPKGYYENTEIHILNDRLILGDLAPIRRFRTTPPEKRGIPLRLVMTLFRARYALTGGTDAISRRAERQQGSIRELARIYEQVAIKDPRFSLTVAAWARYVPINRILYCYRHPYEVARSIQKRYHLPMEVGYHLWHGHVVSFFQQVKGLPLIMVNYEGYFGADPLAEVQRLYAYAGRKYNPGEAQAVLDRVLDPKLKRNVYTGAAIPSYVAEMYERLNRLHDLYAELALFDETEEARPSVLAPAQKAVR